MEMEDWCPVLFKLLTVDLFNSAVFRKGDNLEHYTCTSIPMLVAILVFLEKQRVLSFRHNAEKLKDLFHSRGALKESRKHRTNKSETSSWPDPTKETCPCWEDSLGFTVCICEFNPQAKKPAKSELHEVICMLLYGNTNVSPNPNPGQKLADFRKRVSQAVQRLDMKTLENLVENGKFPVKKGNVDQESDEARERPLNPFLSQSELKSILDCEDEEAKSELMKQLRDDHIAKAWNISVHMEVVEAEDAEEDEEEEVQEEAKSKKASLPLGRLKYLMRPKKPKPKKKGERTEEEPLKAQVVLPKCIAEASEWIASKMMDTVASQGVAYTDTPSEIWNSLGGMKKFKRTATKEDDAIATSNDSADDDRPLAQAISPSKRVTGPIPRKKRVTKRKQKKAAVGESSDEEEEAEEPKAKKKQKGKSSPKATKKSTRKKSLTKVTASPRKKKGGRALRSSPEKNTEEDVDGVMELFDQK